MKSPALLLITVSLACLAACTLRPPKSGEEHMVDSVPLPGEVAMGVTAAPFCLHLRYSNAYFVGFSNSQTESWITQGRCATPGERRSLEALRLSWWYEWSDTQTNRQCLNTDSCSLKEQNAITGRHILCASAQAHEGNQIAFVSTDHARCH